MPPRLLIIGQIDDAEFIGFGEFVGELKGVTFEQVRRLSDLDSQSASVSSANPPELIVVLERHPDEYTPMEVQRLIERHPLARIVCGYGPWSESAGRTRGAWPPAAWVPVAVLPERILAELAVIRGERSPLAITADRADCVEERYASPAVDALDFQSAFKSLRVAVDGPDTEYRSMLEDELNLLAAEVVGVDEAWDILLFDAHPEPHRLRELQRLLDTHSNPILHSGTRESSAPNASSEVSRLPLPNTVIVLHELPSAAVLAQWSQSGLQTDAQVRVVSKLAPLTSLLRLNCWPNGSDSATS